MSPTRDHRAAPTTSTGVEVVGLGKEFPGVVALDDVSISVEPGSVHALLGENGAGKSTLVRALAGQITPDTGVIRIGGEEARFRNVRDARRHGVELLPQDVALVPTLSAGRNVLLGAEPWRTRRTRPASAELARAAQMLETVGATFDPRSDVRSLSVSQQRLVQIARAVGSPARLLILDEPTAVLSDPDASSFLGVLDELRARGRTILYITHRLGEVLEHCDSATVMRNGRVAGHLAPSEVDRQHIIELMLGGRELEVSRRRGSEREEIVLRVSEMTGARLAGAELDVRRGEILGVAGVQGSGIQDLLDAIAGVPGAGDGQVTVEGRNAGSTTRERYASGIAYVPADRRTAGVVTRLTVSDNIAAPVRSRSRRLGFRLRRAESEVAREYVRRFDIRGGGLGAPAGTLSGGNQQKLAISRSLEGRPRVLLVAEPTQGVDVGSKQEIRAQLGDLADQHEMSLVVASSDFEELEGLADRVLVMREGAIVAELRADDITYRSMLHNALG